MCTLRITAHQRVFRDSFLNFRSGPACRAGRKRARTRSGGAQLRVQWPAWGGSTPPIIATPSASTEQLTTDDSWVSLLVKESGLAPSAFESHPMRNMLTSVVGARAELKVTVKEIDLVDGQTIILSTDGLHRPLTDAAMLAIVNAETDIERATTALVETAIKKDGGDDVTILVARYTANA
jgi:hypothetical protein